MWRQGEGTDLLAGTMQSTPRQVSRPGQTRRHFRRFGVRRSLADGTGYRYCRERYEEPIREVPRDDPMDYTVPESTVAKVTLQGGQVQV